MKITKKENDQKKEADEKSEEKNERNKEKQEDKKEDKKEDEENEERIHSNNQQSVSWNILDAYFSENPNALVAPHLESFNHFSLQDIKVALQKENPIVFEDEQGNICHLYLGGKNGEKVAFGKPVIYENNEASYMYPNDARLCNMTYCSLVHVDVEMEILLKKDEKKREEDKKNGRENSDSLLVMDKMLLCKLPIMVNSKLCVLHGLNEEVRIQMGELRNDMGGYFILNGVEKYLPLQEDWCNNEVISLNKYETFVKTGRDTKITLFINQESGEISVSVPFLEKYVVVEANDDSCEETERKLQNIPLFVLFRALGVESDKDIVDSCLLHGHKHLEDLLIPSVHDASRIFSQKSALDYLALFTESNTSEEAYDILCEHLFLHMGNNNLEEKAMFLGYVVHQMLCVNQGFSPCDHPNQLMKKQIETPGMQLKEVFQNLYKQQVNSILDQIDIIFHTYRGDCDKEDPFSFIMQTYIKDFFKEKIVDEGISCYLNQNAISLERNNWYDYISKLRSVEDVTCDNAILSGSYFGYYDPLSSSKQLSLGCFVSNESKGSSIVKWLLENTTMNTIERNKNKSKIFVNGAWVGCVENGLQIVNAMLLLRRNGVFPFSTSVYFKYRENEVRINTESGRFIRPLYFIYKKKPSFDFFDKDNEITWESAVAGRREKHKDAKFSLHSGKVYSVEKLYPDQAAKRLFDHQGYLDFVCPMEENTSLLIANSETDLNKSNFYTHVELDASLMLSSNTSLAPFAEHGTPDCFKEASLLLNNSDTTFQRQNTERKANVLHYGQIPLVTSRYLKLLNKTQQPYGENVVIAVMNLDGYNAAQGIVVNEASAQRGLFYSSLYETNDSLLDVDKGEEFCNPLLKNTRNISGQCSYLYLDENGFPKEGAVWQRSSVAVIGKTREGCDYSIIYHNPSNNLKYVDKVFLTKDQDSLPIGKVIVREEDKLRAGCVLGSRIGTKSGVCLLVPEKDLPFDAFGNHPDIIVSPEVLLSRNGVSQLMEILYGQVASIYGTFMDSTAFQMRGSNLSFFGALLVKQGMQCSGNRVMYSGISGEMLNASIFMGPSFYTKWRECSVDDTTDEVELIDSLATFGMQSTIQDFLSSESIYLAVCNKTGTIAVYNEARNIFYSLDLDGPIGFYTKPNGEMNVKNVSRYGKSFSIVKVPKQFKDLIQELQVCGIQLRVITEKNIDQLFNMSFSHNIHRLLHAPNDKTSDIVIQSFIKKMKLALTNSKIIDVHEEEDDDDKKTSLEEEMKKPISLEDEENKETEEIKIVVNPEVVMEEIETKTESGEKDKKQDELFISTPLIKKVVNESITSDNILKVEDETEKKEDGEKKEESSSSSDSSSSKKSVSFDLKPQDSSSDSTSSSSSVKKISF
jgi:DNA-directed RNA polymerase II subunit RPB2